MTQATMQATTDTKTFTLSEAELVEAQIMMFRRRIGTRHFLLVTIGLVVVLAVLATTEWGRDQLFPVAIGGVSYILLFPWMMRRYVIPRQARALIRDNPYLAQPWHVTIGPDGLDIRNLLGTSRYVWGSLKGRQRGETMLLLTPVTLSFIPIPLRVLTEADLAAIDAHLAEAGVALT